MWLHVVPNLIIPSCHQLLFQLPQLIRSDLLTRGLRWEVLNHVAGQDGPHLQLRQSFVVAKLAEEVPGKMHSMDWMNFKDFWMTVMAPPHDSSILRTWFHVNLSGPWSKTNQSRAPQARWQLKPQVFEPAEAAGKITGSDWNQSDQWCQCDTHLSAINPYLRILSSEHLRPKLASYHCVRTCHGWEDVHHQEDVCQANLITKDRSMRSALFRTSMWVWRLLCWWVGTGTSVDDFWPPSFNHGVWVGGEMPEHIGRGESSSWIKHGGCLRILVACNMMSVISSWPHEISYVCFLIFYSHNLSHRQDSYGRLGPNYNGAVLALELEPVSWLEDVEPKTQKRHPEVKKKSKPVVLKKPSKWVWGDMTWHLMDTCIKTSLEACHLPPWPSVVRAFKPAVCPPSNA